MRRLAPSLLLILASMLALPVLSHAAATRAEFVAQAEPICGLANDDIQGLNERFHRLHEKGRYGAAGRALKRTGTRLSSSIKQVRAITPPPGDEQTLASWLDLIQKVADNNLRLGRAEARRRFGQVVKIENRNEELQRRAHALVADWGFHACAGGS
jgi:hypothetical protein